MSHNIFKQWTTQTQKSLIKAFQAISSKFKAFQGLENCFQDSKLFKGFQGLSEPWQVQIELLFQFK